MSAQTVALQQLCPPPCALIISCLDFCNWLPTSLLLQPLCLHSVSTLLLSLHRFKTLVSHKAAKGLSFPFTVMGTVYVQTELLALRQRKNHHTPAAAESLHIFSHRLNQIPSHKCCSMHLSKQYIYPSFGCFSFPRSFLTMMSGTSVCKGFTN